MGVLRVREEEGPPHKRAMVVQPEDPEDLIPIADIIGTSSSPPNDINPVAIPSSSDSEGEGSSSD